MLAWLDEIELKSIPWEHPIEQTADEQLAEYFYEEKLRQAHPSSIQFQFAAALTPEHLQKAESLFRKALEADPFNLPARNDLALVLLKSQRFEEAEAELNIAVVFHEISRVMALSGYS
jgi:Flp pilus assembly protein TadD